MDDDDIDKDILKEEEEEEEEEQQQEVDEEEEKEEDEKIEVSCQYLDAEQIKVYLEACLNQKIANFQVINDNEPMYKDLHKKEEFEKLKNSKKIPNQDNLFYRGWVYQYEGLKDILSKPDHVLQFMMNHPQANKDDKDKGKDDQKLKNKESKSMKFKFTFGKINIKDLKTQNVLYKKHTSNNYYNFDEYKPSENDITAMTKDLKIIFLYANLGTPTLEDDYEVDGDQNDNDDTPYKLHYKYEFDAERIVYFKSITFDLVDVDERLKCSSCQNEGIQDSQVYWTILDDTDKECVGTKIICTECLKPPSENIMRPIKKIIDCNKYSIRYFWHCQKHKMKEYEFYCCECNQAFCISCLRQEHKSYNKIHSIDKIEGSIGTSYKAKCSEKQMKIKESEKKNKDTWNKIDEAGDKAEILLRARESTAIDMIKKEVLARCIYLASIGYEYQRMISEIDTKKNMIVDMRDKSNIATYLNMNNQFEEEMLYDYLPNLERLEAIPLDKFLETFHKIEKKYPPQDNK